MLTASTAVLIEGNTASAGTQEREELSAWLSALQYVKPSLSKSHFRRSPAFTSGIPKESGECESSSSALTSQDMQRNGACEQLTGCADRSGPSFKRVRSPLRRQMAGGSRPGR
ncbi:hypothetical protein MHYP_G00359560 [Metynnis hypsauchen]